MGYLLAATALIAVVVGFLAGLLTFKRSLQWCPSCGAVLACPECAVRDAEAGQQAHGAVAPPAHARSSGAGFGLGTRNVA
jgi:hypothetical protein